MQAWFTWIDHKLKKIQVQDQWLVIKTLLLTNTPVQLCKGGDSIWKTPTSLTQTTTNKVSASLLFLMDTEVSNVQNSVKSFSKANWESSRNFSPKKTLVRPLRTPSSVLIKCWWVQKVWRQWSRYQKSIQIRRHRWKEL